jgi:CheY-like chemotaxis protein
MPAVVSPTTSPRKIAILVVEDEVLVRAMWVDALRARDYLVVEAANNLRGFDIHHVDAIDVMLTDRGSTAIFKGGATCAACRNCQAL